MPLYEAVFIARQDISSNEVNKLTENFTNFINNNDGKVLKTEYWGLRNLAYKIRKNRKGHYVMLVLDTEFKNITEMERLMKLNENIIKNLTLKIDEFDSADSPMMGNKVYEERKSDHVVEEEISEHKGV